MNLGSDRRPFGGYRRRREFCVAETCSPPLTTRTVVKIAGHRFHDDDKLISHERVVSYRTAKRHVRRRSRFARIHCAKPNQDDIATPRVCSAGRYKHRARVYLTIELYTYTDTYVHLIYYYVTYERDVYTCMYRTNAPTLLSARKILSSKNINFTCSLVLYAV